MSDKIRCCWDGCWRTTLRPDTDGWSFLTSWPQPVKDGYYCRAHVDALEALHLEGGFEEKPG